MFKMKRTLLLMITLFSIFYSCKKSAVPTMIDDEGLAFFGTKIDASAAMSYDDMLKELNGKDTLNVKVKGKIENICQVKGCWMNIVSEKEGNESMFVKFKDYGFFMPLDAMGQEAIMRGKAYREITTVDQLRHYAEDEGQSEEEIAEITEPITELKFMADGVILLPKVQ